MKEYLAGNQIIFVITIIAAAISSICNQSQKLNFVTAAAAHELGHLLMPTENPSLIHSNDILDLMYYRDIAQSPCRIRKRDWNLIDTFNQ